MGQTQTTIINKSEIVLNLPKKYKVVLHNDNHTPMEFVISLLMEIFGHNEQTANDITMEVHNNGKGIAGIYFFEIAEQKVFEATTVSRAHGFPLVLTVEEE
mgnify:FL=1